MIFYLEDDENIRNLTVYTLEQTGHETVGFSCACNMYDALQNQTPDMFILDVMLPDEDGFSVLQNLRSRKDLDDIPIMMLTAKGSEFDKVTGLDAGADDYMSKPFGMMELVSRVNALFRRCKRGAAHSGEGGEDLRKQEQDKACNDLCAGLSDDLAKDNVLEAGTIRLDTLRYEVTVKGQQANLTRKEFNMLAYLLANKGIVITRGQLLDHVWGYSVAGQTRTVDAHMQTLRKKLTEIDPEVHNLIKTVRGVGYKISKG